MGIHERLSRDTHCLLRVVSVVILLGVMVGVSPLNQQAVYAQTSSKKNGSGNNISVSPLRTDLTLRPGESRTVPIYVTNLESKAVLLKPIENDFVASSDGTGAPAIILNEKEYAPTHSLKRYMKPLGLISVQPGERKQVDVVIAVPRAAAAGGYYGALRFAPASLDGSEVVNVSSSVASLIILTVPGDVTESLQLTKFDIQQDGKAVSRLSSPQNVTVSLGMENKGNIQLAPYGNLSVLKGNSTEPIFSTNINDVKPAGLVLPDSNRNFEIPVKKLGKFGKYTFKLVLGYGTNNETIELERSVWIIPTAYIVGGVIGGVFLIALIVGIIFALRAYKKRILRKARRR